MKRIDVSKDEISNLMDCISITRDIIHIKTRVDKIKWYIKNMKTGDWLSEEDTLNTLNEKLLKKFKDY